MSNPTRSALLIGAGSAIGSFLYFFYYKNLSIGDGSALRLYISLCFTITAPFALIFSFSKESWGQIFAQGHAWLYALFCVIIYLTYSEKPFFPADPYLLAKLLSGILIFEIVVVTWGLARTTPGCLDDWSILIFPGLFLSALFGWAVGVLVWSTTVPISVSSSAEDTAGSRPYCLYVGWEPAGSMFALTGVWMRAPNRGGWRTSFHSVLLVRSERGDEFWNWSYRNGQFMRLPEHAIKYFRLPSRIKCWPTLHFARRFFFEGAENNTKRQ